MEWIQELLKNLGPEKLFSLVIFLLWLLASLVQHVGILLRKASEEARQPVRSQEVRGTQRPSLTRPAGRDKPQSAPSLEIPPVQMASPLPSSPQPARPTLETLAEKMIREIEWAMKKTPDETPRSAPAPTPAPASPPAVPQAAPKSVPAPDPVPVSRPVAAPQPSAMRSHSVQPPRRSKPVSAGPVPIPATPAMAGHTSRIAADGRRLTDSGIEIQEAAVIQEARFDHLAVLRSPEDLQKAILLHEILSPPVSMRPRRFVQSRAS
jgi:hypothetical protein